MDSGGASGRWNRVGRAAGDEPGPHALTQIRNQKLEIRNYPYDANGNMMVIDGLNNTWDFKDRLVAVENTEMRAAYTYDYTDRRITKRVAWKPGYPLPSDGRGAGGEGGAISTLYVDKCFEVREHDAPTKYVWNGNTRVARVTGSLNTNLRVQRLRVWQGWNLRSLAVIATNALQQLGGTSSTSPILAAFRWQPATQGWLPVSTNDTLPAGTVLWLNATTNATLSITGAYTNPTDQTLPPGPYFLPSAGLEVWTPGFSRFTNASFWMFDASTNCWLASMPALLAQPTDLPPFIAPGDALFLRVDSDLPLTVPEGALRLRYYHQDHLGSSSVLSDATGQLIEETANYPFGHPRHQFQPRGLHENYQFTQKERDRESDLGYFDARFLVLFAARFTGCDQLCSGPSRVLLQRPAMLNPYCYVLNSPLLFSDPTGNQPEIEPPQGGDRPTGFSLPPMSEARKHYYPNADTGVLAGRIGGGVKEQYDLDTRKGVRFQGCTIKVSFALNKGGGDLSACRDFTKSGAPGADKDWYLLAPRQLSLCSERAGLKPQPLSQGAPSEYADKTGIALFFPYPASELERRGLKPFDATGHAALIAGGECLGTCYFDDPRIQRIEYIPMKE